MTTIFAAVYVQAAQALALFYSAPMGDVGNSGQWQVRANGQMLDLSNGSHVAYNVVVFSAVASNGFVSGPNEATYDGTLQDSESHNVAPITNFPLIVV